MWSEWLHEERPSLPSIHAEAASSPTVRARRGLCWNQQLQLHKAKLPPHTFFLLISKGWIVWQTQTLTQLKGGSLICWGQERIVQQILETMHSFSCHPLASVTEQHSRGGHCVCVCVCVYATCLFFYRRNRAGINSFSIQTCKFKKTKDNIWADKI